MLTKWYQLDRQHEALSLAGKKVIVRTLRDGSVQLERNGVKLKRRELPSRPQRVTSKPKAQFNKPRTDCKPAATHPWRSMPVGVCGGRYGDGDSDGGGFWSPPPAPASLHPLPPTAKEPINNKRDIIS